MHLCTKVKRQGQERSRRPWYDTSGVTNAATPTGASRHAMVEERMVSSGTSLQRLTVPLGASTWGGQIQVHVMMERKTGITSNA